MQKEIYPQFFYPESEARARVVQQQPRCNERAIFHGGYIVQMGKHMLLESHHSAVPVVAIIS
jgi:hypothetical protein